MFNIYVFNYAQMLFIIYARKRIEHDLLIIMCLNLCIAHPSPRTHPAIKNFNFFKFSNFSNFQFSKFLTFHFLPLFSTYLLRSHPLISQAGVQNHESRLVLFSQGRTVIVLFSQGSIVQLIIANDQQSIYSRNGWKHKRVNFLLKFSPAITNNLSTKPLTIFTQISLKQSTAFRQLWLHLLSKQYPKLPTICFPKKPQTLFQFNWYPDLALIRPLLAVSRSQGWRPLGHPLKILLYLL